MITITLGPTTYVHVESPLNIFYLRDFGVSRIHPFSIGNHRGKEENFDYAHGIIEEDELVTLVKEGREIFIRQNEYARYKTQEVEALKRLSKVAAYNDVHTKF